MRQSPWSAQETSAAHLVPPSAKGGHHADTELPAKTPERGRRLKPAWILLKSGERGRNRTYNLLIKSQLLCQLSYAPTVGIWLVGRTKIIASSGRFPQGWRRPHRAVPHGIEGLLRRVCAARAFLQGHRPDPARHSIC